MDPLQAALAWIKAAPRVADVVTPEWDDPTIGGGAGGLAAWAEAQEGPALTYEEALAMGLPLPGGLVSYYRGIATSPATGSRGTTGGKARTPFGSGSGTPSGSGKTAALLLGGLGLLGALGLGIALVARRG